MKELKKRTDMFKASQESEVSNAIKYFTSCYCGLIFKSLGTRMLERGVSSSKQEKKVEIE